MGINWRAGFAAAAQSGGSTIEHLISDEVAQRREIRMSQYQKAQVADERQYQEGVTQDNQNFQREVMGVEAEQSAAAAAAKRAQETADADLAHQRGQDDIRLRANIDPRANKTEVTVNNGQDLDARTEKFSEAIGAQDAERYTSVQKAADSAVQMEDSLTVLEEISTQFDTGKTEQALAMLGQYAGTDAGAAMQAWEGTISPIVLAKAEGLSGVLSDKDMEFLKASVPQFGLDPKANKIMIGLMRKGMERAIENERSMQAHVNEFGNLNNWQAPNKQGTQVNASSSAKTNIGAADDPLGLFK